MKPPLIFKLSPKTILLQWKSPISEKTQDEIRQTEHLFLLHFYEEILETTTTYTELAIYFKNEISISVVKEKVAAIVQQIDTTKVKAPTRIVTIPVCYEAEFGVDLAEVALFHKVTSEEVIILHTEPIYRVSFIGFLPGFPYVSGLSEKLFTPRKKTPRTSVSKGSVGIGGKQTGVYPGNSPGGWNIIGRSPLEFFSVEKEFPSLLQAGDSIQFEAISKKEYELISAEVASGVYPLKTRKL